MPVGPWVVVVGMHRSGTSAVTGALGQLGLAVPVEADRYEPSDDNPDHWESHAIGLHNDAVLERLGGTWDRPPDPRFDWESDPDFSASQLGDPAAAAQRAFPEAGPVAWKDPRACLLLPYWLAHLPRPVAAVFVWRSPLSVARSLQARDKMHLADGVALWERYNRSGLSGLVGVDTFVTRYESIVADPVGKMHELASWLGGLPQFAAHAPGWDVQRAAASISPQLLRQRAASDTPDVLLDEQQQLAEHLEALDGPHEPLASPAPGTESPWTTALLGDRHQLSVLSRQRDGLLHEVFDQKIAIQRLEAYYNELERIQGELARVYEFLERMEGSTSWRVTRPLRQVTSLVARKGTSGGG